MLLLSHWVMYDSLQLNGLQHIRLPCLSLSPRVHPNSCSLSQWCHPSILSSVAPFSSWPQSFPASGSFPVSQLFTSGGQNIRASASASVLPMNIQSWFSFLKWLVWSPFCPRHSQKPSPAPHFESINSSVCSLLYSPVLYITTGKTMTLTVQNFFWQSDVSGFWYTI